MDHLKLSGILASQLEILPMGQTYFGTQRHNSIVDCTEPSLFFMTTQLANIRSDSSIISTYDALLVHVVVGLSFSFDKAHSALLLCRLSAAALYLAWYMISYDAWRHLYVRPYKKGLYVAYNLENHFKPKDSVTVSEASGYIRRSCTRFALISLLSALS